MFPSQDVPEALSTWSAYVTVSSGFVVLMSGDHNPDVSIAENGLTLKMILYTGYKSFQILIGLL